MNKVIVPCGYMGSGSSAITSLLQEYASVDASKGRFEYVFLHCPDGVFDLEDKLLKNNTVVRSDEALHRFYDQMKKMFYKKYYWVGHYDVNVSKNFMNLVDEFMRAIVQYKPDFYWYYQEDTNARMIVQLTVRKIVNLLTLHKVKLKKPLVYDQMWISYVNEDEFYQAAKQFIGNILNELGINEKSIVLDQLLLPHNLKRQDRYFDDCLRCIVVERDPRDVFISNKYIWPSQGEQVPFPTDAEEFCVFYERLRSFEEIEENSRILRIQFEDLIYYYDKEVLKIEEFIGLDVNDHIRPRTDFNPDISINNTQLFLNKKYAKEIEIIEKKLNKYLYNFPYERITDESKVF